MVPVRYSSGIRLVTRTTSAAEKKMGKEFETKQSTRGRRFCGKVTRHKEKMPMKSGQAENDPNDENFPGRVCTS